MRKQGDEIMSMQQMKANALIGRSTVWDLSGANIVRSALYTFAMARFVYIKVSGAEAPIKTEADNIEKRNINESMTGGEYVLILKKDGQEVGEFKGAIVEGWWIQNE